MFSNTIKEWQAYISELDEFFGEEPRYPLTTIQQHISSEIRSQNEIILHSSKYLSDNITNEIANSTSAICGTLENGFNSLINVNQQGFETLSYDLQNIDDTLNQIGGAISWGFDRVVDQIKTSNLFLTNINLLLQIPESQKERQEYIKDGLKFYQNSRFDKTLYEDALENFLEAEKIKKTDYFILQKIGIIYLYSVQNLDVKKALDYFLRASKYSYIETLDNTVKSNNLLDYNITEDLKNKIRDVLDIKKQTADSYVYAGRCYYILKDYENALKYASKAFDILPSNLNAGFEKAKYLSKLGQTEKALNLLNNLVEKNKFIARKTTSDYDLISNSEVVKYLESIALRKRTELSKIINHLSKKTENRLLNEQIKKLNSLYDSNDYISSSIAIEDVNKNYNYTEYLIKPLDVNSKLYSSNLVEISTTPIKLYDYIQYSKDKLSIVNERYEIHEDLKNNRIKINQVNQELKEQEEQENSSTLIFAKISLFAGIGFFIFWRFLINTSKSGGYDNWFNLFFYILIGLVPSIILFFVSFLGFNDYFTTEVPIRNKIKKLKIEKQKLNSIQQDLKRKENKLKSKIENIDLELIEKIL